MIVEIQNKCVYYFIRGDNMIVIKKDIQNSQINLSEDVNNKKAIVIILDEFSDDKLQKIRNKLSKIPYSIAKKLIQERG